MWLLGFCVAAITASYAAYCYKNMDADLQNRARTTTDYFKEAIGQDYDTFYQSCITYAETFDQADALELQFIDQYGKIVASSYGTWAATSPRTPEVQEAISTRTIQPFVGRDPDTGERIMAVSSPMIYSNGQVIGVLRYVTSTAIMDREIVSIAFISITVLVAALVIILLFSSFFIRSVMLPVEQITEKAKRIANGSYGAQIKTKYNDEIADLAETINEMSVKISQNEKMQAEFISQLSHELRTPLTVINGWSETLLADESLDADTAQGLKIISSEAKRLTEMVMELLDFTRLQDGRMTLNVEQTDIRTADLPQVDFIGTDVSFISLKLILPHIYRLLKSGGRAAVLIKPQFEAGRPNLSKKGIVRDEKVRLRIRDEIAEFAQGCGFSVIGTETSPITGGDGNTEYLMCLEKR